MSIWPGRSCSDYAVYILVVYYHGYIYAYVMQVRSGATSFSMNHHQHLPAITASAEWPKTKTEVCFVTLAA